MAYDPGAIDATLAAAVGDDPQLIVELRRAFGESARRAFAAVEQADSDTEWTTQLRRLKSLAGSFGAVRLMAAADEAMAQPARDPQVLRQLRRLVPRR